MKPGGSEQAVVPSSDRTRLLSVSSDIRGSDDLVDCQYMPRVFNLDPYIKCVYSSSLSGSPSSRTGEHLTVPVMVLETAIAVQSNNGIAMASRGHHFDFRPASGLQLVTGPATVITGALVGGVAPPYLSWTKVFPFCGPSSFVWGCFCRGLLRAIYSGDSVVTFGPFSGVCVACKSAVLPRYVNSRPQWACSEWWRHVL